MYAGFEIRRKSASLTCARTRQIHSTRAFSDLRRSFVRYYDISHNDLLLNNGTHLSFISSDKQKALKIYTC